MKKIQLLKQLQNDHEKGKKSFALLIDPDNISEKECLALIEKAVKYNTDYIFVGGSLITGDNLHLIVQIAKEKSQIPVVLFPGSNLHIDTDADAILFLSLISGRNPDFLIGQHIISAPILKRSSLEILPTGYILVDSGRQTTVSYISNTTPIPHDKPSVAACTAMAGEMLGLQIIYMDAGSGAEKAISTQMIGMVRKNIDIPLIIGGGINTTEKAKNALKAGADVIVIGNAIEKDTHFLEQIAGVVHKFNTQNI
jgi:phosphoglycerol geranylgeranyltransferase